MHGRTGVFEARHAIDVIVPEGTRELQLWVALPQKDDDWQRVKDLNVDAPFAHEVRTDADGNEFLYLSATNPSPGPAAVVTTFTVERDEAKFDAVPANSRLLTDAERASLSMYLAPNEHIVIDDRIRGLAEEIAGGETNPVAVAKRIYDWQLDNIDYWVKDPANKKASPVGSSEYCLTTGTGNCTDFHSLFAALSRASGVPTQIVYGSFFKQSLDGVADADQSYHCWIEFYAPELGWVPLDVAIADIFVGDFPFDDTTRKGVTLTTADGYSGADAAKVQYYFGNLEERRVTWNRGRDLRLDPAPAAGALNAVPKAYLEIDGKSVAEKQGWTRKLTFREVK
jgi:transglutaminase-like putative cysteine protease